ncbi:putative spherulin-1A [Colletotrichum sublineola]|uniref:Putative spherulin-1A n=1 Tax=Colletotrichum sublineola TaxID=1173701 RepID=A0A066XBH1_COLSU|nr:putative spherulin-1A [Colletotrichum sublineola]
MITFSMMPKGLSLLLLCLHFVGTNAMDDTVHPELVRLLRTSPTELDKMTTLSDDQDWTFNYFAHRYHTHSPGGVVNAKCCYIFSNSCVNATLISALSSEDAGTQNVANGLFDLPLSVVAAAFGGSPLSAQFAQLRRDIPVVGTGASMGTTKCIQRCEASGYKKTAPALEKSQELPGKVSESSQYRHFWQLDFGDFAGGAAISGEPWAKVVGGQNPAVQP